jgi:hypothetical protein
MAASGGGGLPGTAPGRRGDNGIIGHGNESMPDVSESRFSAISVRLLRNVIAVRCDFDT